MLISTIVRVFSLTQAVTALDFRFRSDTVAPKAQWRALLNGFPHLAALRVQVRSSRNLFRVLRETPDLCPTLKALSVTQRNGTGAHELIVSTIEHRASRGLRLDLFELYQIKEAERDTPLSSSRTERIKQHVGKLYLR